jgi:hypothetical protein
MTAVPLPLSPLYVLLILAIPGVWLLARAITHRLTRDRSLRAVLPIGLGLAIWVVAVHLASLLAHSFRVGLPAGALAAAAAGVAMEIARRRAPDEPATGEAPSRWMWITAIVAAAALAPAAFNYWFHDEVLIGGHMATVAQIQTGIYPPRRIQFPDVPFRYHYGFDLLSACFTALLRVRNDTGIDVSSVVLWASSWCLLWALGERLVGRPRAWLLPVTTLLASGMPVGCPHPGTSIVPNMISECPVGHWSVNGPVISYFFQHPWALGIPVATTAILVFTERAPRDPWVRFGLLAFLFAALSFSELVLYVTVLPSMLVAELRYEDRIEIRRAPAMLGAAALSFGVAKLMGGFFAHAEGVEGMKFIPHLGFADTPIDTLRWNAMTFGVMWLTGLAGLVVLKRARVLFGLLFLGALLVVNGLRFTGSADIMKFATVVQLSLGLLGGVFLAHLLSIERLARPVRIAITAVLFAATTWVGFSYPVILAFRIELPGSYRQKPENLSPADVEATTFLRRTVRAGEMIYRTNGAGYAQWAGLPQPWLDWTKKQWGIPQARLQERERILRVKPANLDEWRAQAFRWFVLDENAPGDRSLVDASNRWIAAGSAKIAAHFGSLRVVEIAP